MNNIDTSCKLSNRKILYADDTTFCINKDNSYNSTVAANNNAQELYMFCRSNGLLVNTSKTFFIQFLPKNICPDRSMLIKMNHRSICMTDSFRFLGVIVDQKMTWEPHIDNVVAKLSSVCFLIRQLKSTVSIGILKLVYFAMVQSVLSYGLIHWGASAHLDKAFVIQKRIIKCIMSVHPLTSCKHLFVDLKILTLPSLYIYLIVIDFIMYRKNSYRNCDIHNYDTRTKNNIHCMYSRLSLGQRSHEYQQIICYNKFIELFGVLENTNDIKTVLLDFLVNMAFYSVQEYLHYPVSNF